MHLADLGFSDETIAKLFTRDFAGRVGFPNYALAIGDQLRGLSQLKEAMSRFLATNNSANIRRLEQRLAKIQNVQHDETTGLRCPGPYLIPGGGHPCE